MAGKAHVGRIFATLGYPGPGWAMVSLSPLDQQSFLTMSDAFVPVKGKWGEQGATNVLLRKARVPAVRAALSAAYERTTAGARRPSRAKRRS